MTVTYEFIDQSLKNLCIPRYLCRYLRDDEHIEDTVSTPYLWFSSPSEFNDPFDCNKSFNTDNSFEELIWWMQKFGKADPEALNVISAGAEKLGGFEKIRDFVISPLSAAAYEMKIGEISICCCSDTNENPLMWSHYSQGHRGLCMLLDTHTLIAGGMFSLLGVEYADELPDYNLIKERKKFGSSNQFNVRFDQAVLGTKLSYWEYENEHRLISHFNGKNQIPNEAVKGVVFGAKMAGERVDYLTSQWSTLNPSIKFEVAKLDTSSGNLSVDLFKNEIDCYDVTKFQHLASPA